MHWRLHNLMVGAWMVWRVRICRMVMVRRRGYIVVQWILLRVAWLLRRRAGLLWLLLLKLLWILWIVGRLVRRWRCAVEARVTRLRAEQAIATRRLTMEFAGARRRDGA